MPDEPVSPTLLADKYKDRDALNKGYVEIRKALGLADDDPARFKDDASLASEYKALERAHGVKAPAVAATTAKPNSLAITAPEPASADEIDITTIVKDVGLDENDLAKQWGDKGELTADQYAAFRTSKRLSRSTVDAMMAGQSAIAQLAAMERGKAATEAETLAGGKPQHDTLRQWAATPGNIDAAKLAAWNAVVAKSPATYPAMVEWMMAEHAKKIGAGGAKPIVNPGGGTTDGLPKTPAEQASLMQRAVRGDPAAVAMVESMTTQQLERFSAQ